MFTILRDAYNGYVLHKKYQCYFERENRLNNNIRTLYHQTSYTNADNIIKENRLLPGTTGLAGGGIYFATCPNDTHHKALNKGVILRCDVRLGETKTIDRWGDSSITFQNLLDSGHDSVLITRSGDEYVVYNPDQVKSITVYKKLKNNYHSHSYNKKTKFKNYGGPCDYQPSG